MEIKDRVSQNPGRIKLIKSDGTEEICQVALCDNATELGTPLNKEFFDTYKQEILENIALLGENVTCTMENGVLYITLKQ